MDKLRLGKTDLWVSRTAFGALPLQRTPMDEAVRILRAAYRGGINFFDTANSYSDSEEKIGRALSEVRHEIVIATKSGGKDKKTVAAHLDNSLLMLKTDYIDIYQFHNAPEVFSPDDPDGPFAAVLEGKKAGKIRHIGITTHRIPVAKEAIRSGYFESLQFPFSYLATDEEVELARLCEEADIGFIAMKGLAGGLLTNAAACRAYIRQFPNVVPIWGIQHMSELEEWLALEETEPVLTPELQAVIDADRKELTGGFCRGCGYCMPCPVGIEINFAARMNRLLRRSPYQRYMTEAYYQKMHRIDNCLHCNQCSAKCPYGLDTPALLQEMLADYDRFYAEHHGEAAR